MKDILYNLDSVAVTYGDNVLTSVVQVNERINEIVRFFDLDKLNERTDKFNDFEKTESADRIDQLVELNQRVRSELELQEQRLREVRDRLRKETSLPSTV